MIGWSVSKKTGSVGRFFYVKWLKFNLKIWKSVLSGKNPFSSHLIFRLYNIHVYESCFILSCLPKKVSKKGTLSPMSVTYWYALIGESVSIILLSCWWKIRPPLGKLQLPDFHQLTGLNDRFLLIDVCSSIENQSLDYKFVIYYWKRGLPHK